MEKSPQHEAEFRIPPSASSFEELAAQQDVPPILDFESLMGKPSAEDESAEECSALLRTWRRDATGALDPNERRDP